MAEDGGQWYEVYVTSEEAALLDAALKAWRAEHPAPESFSD